MRIFTVGYEKIGIDDLRCLVDSLEVNLIVDIRRTPRSRHQWWNREYLEGEFPNYVWVGLLAERDGGLVNPEEGVRQVERAIEGLDCSPEHEPRILLLCYEDDPRVCHRMQVAHLLQERFSARHGYVGVEHVRASDLAQP